VVLGRGRELDNFGQRIAVLFSRLWLFNRQPGRRRDRKNVEVVVGIEHRISLMSSEERLEELRRLQAKVDLLMGNVIERETVEVNSED